MTKMSERPVLVPPSKGRHPKARSASGLDIETWKAVMARDDRICQIDHAWICEAVATQVDHIVPQSKGGTDDVDNLRAACGPCNRAEYIRVLTEKGEMGAAFVMGQKWALERRVDPDSDVEVAASVRIIIDSPKGCRQVAVRSEAARLARNDGIEQRRAFMALVGAGVAAGVNEQRAAIDVRVAYKAAPPPKGGVRKAEMGKMCSTKGCGRVGAELDHILPKAEGGAVNDEANLQWLCTSCHRAKSAAENRLRALYLEGKAAKPEYTGGKVVKFHPAEPLDIAEAA